MAKADLSPPKIRWMVEPTFDDDGVQRTSGVDQFGREHPDPVPMAVPVRFANQKDTLHESLRALVRQELFRQAVEQEGFETFEESDDFDVDDDYFPVDPHTPYEAVFDPPAQEASRAGGEVGRSPTLAGEAPNGENRAPDEATRQPTSSASGTASGDLASQVSPAMMEQKPIAVDTRVGVESSARTDSFGKSRKPGSPGR